MTELGHLTEPEDVAEGEGLAGPESMAQGEGLARPEGITEPERRPAGQSAGEPEVRPLSQFLGDPDGFERLWTPHRLAYLEGEGKPAHDDEGDECPFCRAPKLSDDEALIVARGDLVYAVLNLYPYNPGHLMVVPYRHRSDYTELTTEEVAELGAYTRFAMRAVRSVSAPHGFNVGMNLGAVAGAGIAAHLHQHVVPRWGGDTNFVPIVARTRVLSQVLADTRTRIAEAWPAQTANTEQP